MRSFLLFLSLLLTVVLAGCGSEEELNPPTFSNITINGSAELSRPVNQLPVIISGRIDDFNAKIVANTLVTGESTVNVNNSDGSWSFSFNPLADGFISVTFTATDQRGNINQLYLTINHDTHSPEVLLLNGVTQDLTDPSHPKLIVSFNETLLDTSLETATFTVLTTDITIPLFAENLNSLTPNIVTLPLVEALPVGIYSLTCPGVKDIAFPDGNSISADYSYPFTIAE